MKILYFGTVCDLSEYEKILSKSGTKVSVATIVFESSLLAGLKQNGAEVDVYSFPMIPTFPSSKLPWWGKRKEKLNCGYGCTWLTTVNFPIIKQFSRRLCGRRILKKWLKANRGGECAVLSYSIPPFLAGDIIKYSKKYGVKCIPVVTDLLKYMYINARDGGFVSYLKNRYLSDAIKHQGDFDGYVYLTEAMSEEVNPQKPYMVMEGIADTDIGFSEKPVEKTTPPFIMYAGMLEEEYGIINLLDAFEKTELGDTELWLFGSGNGIEKVSERARLNPKIRPFGRVNRDEVLAYEQKASLLVNPRSSTDEYTKYSFPSKTIEYMLSGTPVLTTKLQGIPDEYYDYVFSCDNNDADSLSHELEKAMALSAEERSVIGERAKRFITEEKNKKKQAKRVLEFISEVLKS